jgi:hypothetical protein
MLVLALFAAKVVISSSSRVKRDTSSIAKRTWGVPLGLDADYCGCWVDTKPSRSVPVGELHVEKPAVFKEQPVAGLGSVLKARSCENCMYYYYLSSYYDITGHNGYAGTNEYVNSVNCSIVTATSLISKEECTPPQASFCITTLVFCVLTTRPRL